MAHVNDLLNERLKKGATSAKMTALAKQSANGNLTSFSGIFNPSELNEHEKNTLELLLTNFASASCDISSDLNALIAITSEVKSISNQAAILHGERIKKAQTILKAYKEGAFTAWLLAAYGNRQTPYNFLKYYEFCESLPKGLKSQLDLMPRQAVYTLASRDAPLSHKQKIVEQYKGETKENLLKQIREHFPLENRDRRKKNIAERTIHDLVRVCEILSYPQTVLSKSQKQTILNLLNTLKHKLEN